MTGTLTKEDFISKYGYNGYKDIKDFVVDNLTILKYKRIISGYKVSNNKNYAIIYLPRNKKDGQQKYININLIKLYSLMIKDIDTLILYIDKNYKIKEVV